MELFDLPTYGTELKNLFENKPNNVVVREAIKVQVERMVKEILMDYQGEYSIDHDLRKVALAQHDEELLKLLMTTCPPDMEYEIYIGGEHIGWVTYDGIKGYRDRVTMDFRIRLKEPLKFITVDIKL